MTVPESLLMLLVCPETKQTLQQADQAMLAEVNARIARGEVKNRVGKVIAHPLEDALIRADQKMLFPVVGAIPVLLIDDAIAIA